MKRLALALTLSLALAACAGAQLVPIGQPIKVRQLPPCNQRTQNLAFYVIDATADAICTAGGTGQSICTCNAGNWVLMAGAGSVSDHGMLAGLGDDDHTQYLLLAGRPGGQEAIGSSVDNQFLTLTGNTSGEASVISLGDFDSSPSGILMAVDASGLQTINTLAIAASGVTATLDSGDTFTLSSGGSERFRVETTGIIGTDARIRVGQSDSDANSTCISVTADHLYGDLDCDSVKDAGEYLLDDESGKWVPMSSATTTTLEVTGATADLDINVVDDVTIDTTGANGEIDLTTAGQTGKIYLTTTGNLASINLSAGSSLNLASVSAMSMNVNGGDIDWTVGEGYVSHPGYMIDTPQAASCADNGAGTNAALTLTPTADLVEITSLDANGCDVTLSEAGMSSGRKVEIVVVAVTAGTVNFADSAGVTELAGAFNAGIYDSLRLRYTTSRWVEVGRSNN